MEKGKQTSESNSKKKQEDKSYSDWVDNLIQKLSDKKIMFNPLEVDKEKSLQLMRKMSSLHKPIYDVVSIFDVHQLLLNLGIVMSITDIHEQFVKMHRPSEFQQWVKEKMPGVLEQEITTEELFFSDPTKGIII
jgi:hypothetical protein